MADEAGEAVPQLAKPGESAFEKNVAHMARAQREVVLHLSTREVTDYDLLDSVQELADALDGWDPEAVAADALALDIVERFHRRPVAGFLSALDEEWIEIYVTATGDKYVARRRAIDAIRTTTTTLRDLDAAGDGRAEGIHRATDHFAKWCAGMLQRDRERKAAR